MDQREAQWRQALNNESVAFGSFCLLSDTLSAEALVIGGGLDFVLLDLQHGVSTLATLAPLVQAVTGAGAVAVVRVPSLQGDVIGQALDRGARAVVVPMVETAEQARAIVAATRYAPAGTRSYGPLRRAGSPTECFAMIETVEGLRNVDSIAATPGLAGLFLGPTDLAISMELPVDYDPFDPRHNEATAAVAAAANRHHIAAAAQTFAGEEVQLRLRQGYSVVSMRSDLSFIRSGIADLSRRIRQGMQPQQA